MDTPNNLVIVKRSRAAVTSENNFQVELTAFKVWLYP